MQLVAAVVLLGVGATAATDLWALLRRRLLGMPPPDWALVGRWMAGMPRGRFHRGPIAGVPPVAGERAIGWAAHYLIGVSYAALLPAIWGTQWLQQPTLAPPMLIGVGTVLAPFLLMQPGMGLGVAARLSPHPGKARLHSLLMHAVFGLGLYASARLLAALS